MANSRSMYFIFSGFIVYYSIWLLVFLQGGLSGDGGLLTDQRRLVAAYYGVLVLGSTLTLISGVGMVYARHPGAGSGIWRLPSFIDHVNDVQEIVTGHRSVFATTVQITAILVVFIPALYSLGHANRVLRIDGRLWNEGWPIALTNSANVALGWPRLAGQGDRAAYQCPAVLSPPADIIKELVPSGASHPGNRLWLVSDCDLQRWFEANGRAGDAFTPDQLARVPPCVKEQAKKIKVRSECTLRATGTFGPLELSRPCEESARNCRGVQWLPFWSAFLVHLTTVAGVASALWVLLGEVMWTWVSGGLKGRGRHG